MATLLQITKRVEFYYRILCKNLHVPVFRVRFHFLKHGLIKHV